MILLEEVKQITCIEPKKGKRIKQIEIGCNSTYILLEEEDKV